MESKPRVRAFHVFRAIRARARGTRAVALNLRPRRNGITTFLMIPRSVEQDSNTELNAMYGRREGEEIGRL
jgi:hypothetical protein